MNADFARQPMSDPRKNAPPTLSSKHGEARTRELAARAERGRRHYMATYAGEQPVKVRRDRGEHPLVSLALVVMIVIALGVLWGVLPR